MNWMMILTWLGLQFSNSLKTHQEATKAVNDAYQSQKTQQVDMLNKYCPTISELGPNPTANAVALALHYCAPALKYMDGTVQPALPMKPATAPIAPGTPAQEVPIPPSVVTPDP